jgi:hypothetical protein
VRKDLRHKLIADLCEELTIMRGAEDVFVRTNQRGRVSLCSHPFVEHADLVGKLTFLVRHACDHRQSDPAKTRKHF